MQTWSFAAETNNDRLASSVTAILALLLKTISVRFELREYGILLCKSVLQETQLRRISRFLSAPKHKDFLISPCLRLLTEIVSFDGGSLAKQVYSKRDFTFENKTLLRNLYLKWTSNDGAIEDRRKQSVRSNAVRYLLVNFKFQSEGSKIDILKQSNLLKALFDGMKDDPPELAGEILVIVKGSVIEDKALPRRSKSNILTERNLSNVLLLLRQSQAVNGAIGGLKSVKETAETFLMLVCTKSELGALISGSGWYPQGADKDISVDGDVGYARCGIDLGLHALPWYGKYSESVPVRNTVLADFAQGLRPYASVLEGELLLAIFTAAPELVADYFHKKGSFTFDPKLSATWIGYSSLLFSTIQLPVPRHFGRKESGSVIPPPTFIVIENILPRPLSRKVVSKCLNHSSGLIRFFAVRILVIAFKKLLQVLVAFQLATPAGKEALWVEAATALKSEFSNRIPPMKDIVNYFRAIPRSNLIQREAVGRLLVSYYEIVPQIALEERFDVSVTLTQALANENLQTDGGKENELHLLDLGHLVRIASNSPDMRWWNKPGELDTILLP